MLKRLLKMLSGLVPLWRRKVAGRLDACDTCGASKASNQFGIYHESGFTCQGCCDTGYFHSPPHVDDSPSRAADYRVCNKCSAFLTKDESSYFTCHRCSVTIRRSPPRLV